MNLKKITNISLLSALSLLLMEFVKTPLIPAAPFLIYEPGDVPVLIIGFIYGPLSGVMATFILSIIGIFTGSGGLFGAIMRFLASGTLVFIATLIYQKRHDKYGAIMGLLAGSVMMTLMMILANLGLTPIFYGMPYEQVAKLLVPAIIPFNVLKGIINSAITILVYKKIRGFLKERGLLKSLNN